MNARSARQSMYAPAAVGPMPMTREPTISSPRSLRMSGVPAQWAMKTNVQKAPHRAASEPMTPKTMLRHDRLRCAAP
ncbi:MAG: hypothetical protein WKG00_23915 [Polyangiaceae bacterium]